MAKKKSVLGYKKYRFKNQMDYAAQLKNMMEFMGMAGELILKTNWKDYFAHRKHSYACHKKRIEEELTEFFAMSKDEKIDVLLNGEKKLGRLYREGEMATVRREWRGVRDTLVDFGQWLKVWGMFLFVFGQDLIPSLNTLFHYRWFVSYLAAHSFMDKQTMGMKGRALKMAHLLIYDIFRYVAENIVVMAKCDRRNGNCVELSERVVLFDEMTMGQMMAGFPDVVPLAYQLLPVFLVSEVDQLTCIPYIDAVEAYGLAADTCPVPTSECGALVIDALPHMGKCFISSSMPCDGSTMASSYMARRFPDLPIFHLALPVRYLDEATLISGVGDMKACIKWVEEVADTKWDWDNYFTCMRRFNEQTRYEIRKWDINKTDYPQIIGPCYELFRKWNYEMDGGLDPRVTKTFKKVDKLLHEAYEAKDEAWVGKMKYRALVWSCPAHYYANFSNWLANCWGINVLVEMESLNFTKPLETEDKEEAIRDLVRLYERMVMRRHTNGGYQNVVDELWRQCELWNAKLVIMYQHVACVNMATVQGLFDEQARQLGIDLIWVEHDLMDPRTVSRRSMRDKVSTFMRAVYNAEPVDESLVDFEDDVTW